MQILYLPYSGLRILTINYQSLDFIGLGKKCRQSWDKITKTADHFKVAAFVNDLSSCCLSIIKMK